jgi:hypothetical protein
VIIMAVDSKPVQEVGRMEGEAVRKIARALKNPALVGLKIRKVGEDGIKVVSRGLASDVTLFLRQDKAVVERERGLLEIVFSPSLWFAGARREKEVVEFSGGPIVESLWLAMPMPEKIVYTRAIGFSQVPKSEKVMFMAKVEDAYLAMADFSAGIMAASEGAAPKVRLLEPLYASI